jgi:ABC-type sugar transport system substrate-binding protein
MLRKAMVILACICMLLPMALGCEASTAIPTGDSTSSNEIPDEAPVTSTDSENTDTAIRITQEREDVKPGGQPVTNMDLPLDIFPGLTELGVIPKKQYFIAFSNGEYGVPWCVEFVEDMEKTAERYNEEFGLRYEWTNAGNNSTKQLSDVQSLIAKKPDLLILYPNEGGPLSVVADWCKEANIPLICINSSIDREAGKDYVSVIMMDGVLNGISRGVDIVDTMTEKYGEPKGNLAEIAGILGHTISKQWSQGANYVLKDYPDLNIIVSRPGEWDPSTAYAAAQDILTMYPEGKLDAFYESCDETALAAIEAIEAAGRSELDYYHYGANGSVQFIKNIVEKKAYSTVEQTPFYGMHAFEYAIRYLNGEDIPPIAMIPQRKFSAETPEKAAALQEIVDYCDANGYSYVPIALGYYDQFDIRSEEVMKYYDVPYYEAGGDKYFAIEPYIETEPTF